MRNEPSLAREPKDMGGEVFREFERALREGPSSESVAKMSEQLVMAGVLDRANGGKSERNLLYWKIAGLLVLAGGVVLGWRAAQSGSFSTNTTNAGRVVVAAAPASNTIAAVVGEPAVAAAVSVDELPAAVPVVPPTRNAPATRTSGNRADRRSADGEFELIQRAETALASDPARTLDAAREHARSYPAGEFVQEREILAVEALARLGRRDEALIRARTVLRQFPRTPYAARLEMAVGQPVAPVKSNVSSH